jgi:hypothetical protein
MYDSEEEIIAILKKRTKRIAPTGLTMDSVRAANKAA